jgi:hypothetical protein
MVGEQVTLWVTGDPYGWEYSGVNESWILYTLTSAAGYATINVLGCGGLASECNVTLGPWSEDYTIDFTGFSRDRAGNVGWSQPQRVLVRKHLALLTSVRDIYLSLGSYEYLQLDLSNRQNVNEHITVTIDEAVIPNNYRYAKFVEVSDGVLSQDKKTVNITLSPLETKPVTIMVYTASIGNQTLTVYANSTLLGHEDINDFITVNVRTLFPVEFPGLSWPAVIVLLFLAGLAYLRFGAARE